MRRFTYSLLSLLFAVALMGSTAPLEAASSVGFSVTIGGGEGAPPGMFYQQLSPYGNWVWLSQFGWAWHPLNVESGWRPYTAGHWVFTDDGWTWLSSWPWGWACFHYGRWAYDDDYGWVWVPGTNWGPAWVIWRTGGDWIGWAPLPPGAYWRGDHLAGIDWDRIPEWQFSFVRDRDFLNDHLRDRIEGPEFNVRVFDRTNPVVNYRMREGHIVDRNDMRDHLARVMGHSIEQRRLAEVGSLDELHHGEERHGEVRVFRPNHEELMRRRGEERLGARPNVPPEIAARQGRERQQLEQRQNRERQALEARQRQERRQVEREARREGRPGSPNSRVERDQMLRRQQAERRAFEQQMHRERRVIEQAQRREAEQNAQRAERQEEQRNAEHRARPTPPHREGRPGRH
jgi:hypothetical protein